MRRILLIDGHPSGESLIESLCEAYAEGASEVDRLVLRDLSFAPTADPRSLETDEPDVIEARDRISAAEHVTLAFPIWWGSFPALTKGFVDRVLVSGFGFRYGDGPMPERLLGGRSARLITTMDSPRWWNRYVYGRPAVRAMKTATLGFCGFKPVHVTEFAQVRSRTPDQIRAWIESCRALGRTDAA